MAAVRVEKPVSLIGFSLEEILRRERIGRCVLRLTTGRGSSRRAVFPDDLNIPRLSKKWQTTDGLRPSTLPFGGPGRAAAAPLA